MTTSDLLLERARHFRRLDDLLNREAAADSGVPFLATEFATNVLAWARLRDFFFFFKQSALRRIEMVLGFVVVVFALLFALLIYQRARGFHEPINNEVTYVAVGYIVIALGFYLAHPVLSLGLHLNATQDGWLEFWERERWRLAAEAQVCVIATAAHSVASAGQAASALAGASTGASAGAGAAAGAASATVGSIARASASAAEAAMQHAAEAHALPSHSIAALASASIRRRLRFAGVDEERRAAQLRESSELAERVHSLLVNVPYQFAVMGVAVNNTLVGSILSAVTASVVSYLVSFFTGGA